MSSLKQFVRTFEDSTLRLGVTEGGGAPMLIISSKEEYETKEGILACRRLSQSYVFADPTEVSDLIKALSGYSEESQRIARSLR